MDVVRLIVELAKATKSDILAFITEQAASEGWTVPQYMFLQAVKAGVGRGAERWQEFVERLAQTASSSAPVHWIDGRGQWDISVPIH